MIFQKNSIQKIFKTKFSKNIQFKNYSKLFFLKYSIQKVIHFRISEEIQFKNIILNWNFSWIQFKKLFKTGFFLGFNSKKYSFNTKKGVPPMASTSWGSQGIAPPPCSRLLLYQPEVYLEAPEWRVSRQGLPCRIIWTTLCPIGSPLGDPGPLGDLFVDLGPL